MNSPAGNQNHVLRALVLSLIAHGAFFVCVVLFGTRARVVIVKQVTPQRVADLQISGGSHRIRLVLPVSNMSATAKDPDPIVDPAKKTVIPMQAPPVKKSGGGSPAVPNHGNGSGKAVFGNGPDNIDMTPAFPVFSPHPPIHDRSLLPQNADKIVVDVDVDEAGQVVKETLVKGIGNQLDAMVMDIVKTWRFEPAKVNGKPVASQAEVVFPLDLNYPIASS